MTLLDLSAKPAVAACLTLLLAGCAASVGRSVGIVRMSAAPELHAAVANATVPPLEQTADEASLQAIPPDSPDGSEDAIPASHVSADEESILPLEPESVPPGEATPPEPEAEGYPIDLPTAWRLAGAQNLQVALASEQVRQALARVQSADALWLPSIRAGLNYNKHEGAIQDVEGQQFEASRGALYAGMGAGGFGAGSPSVPGVYANFHLADALFQPLAARQLAGARRRGAAAATHDVLWNVSQSYLELLRAGQDVPIATETQRNVAQLADLTAAYASSGEGLQADADRSQVELALRVNDLARSQEARQVASARLAQLLRLDPTIQLQPSDQVAAPIELVPDEAELPDLIAQALSARPELGENRFLVAEAIQRLRRERFAPLIPSLVVGTSYGGMGAGTGGTLTGTHGRLDVDAVAFWEMRNLGLGDQAARQVARSAVRQARVRHMAAMDLVAREVTEAHTQVQARRRQITTAQQAVEAAASSYTRNLERIQAGQGLPIEVLQSIQALAQARREYLRTVIDYNQAQFALYRALGWPVKSPLE